MAQEPQEQHGEAQDPLDQLSPSQQRTIIELVNQNSVRKAAEAAGVGERTVYTWLQDPVFKRLFHQLLKQNFRQAMSLSQRLAPAAINTLAKTMADASAPHASRVAAANSLLKYSRESIELDELAERVEAVEEQVAAAHNRGASR